MVLAGYILGKALAIHSEYEAVMTQSYGPEARGGASSANLIVADEPIDYPFETFRRVVHVPGGARASGQTTIIRGLGGGGRR